MLMERVGARGSQKSVPVNLTPLLEFSLFLWAPKENREDIPGYQCAPTTHNRGRAITCGPGYGSKRKNVSRQQLYHPWILISLTCMSNMLPGANKDRAAASVIRFSTHYSLYIFKHIYTMNKKNYGWFWMLTMLLCSPRLHFGLNNSVFN